MGRDEPLVSYNSTVARNPASTMKVLTTYAALELLGPAFTWRTRAFATGPVRDRVLDGNLVLVGGGDPFMTADRWWGFVAGLRQQGIERVTGDVIIDNSYFAPQGDDRSAFDNQPYRTYNVLPDALLVNFQTVDFSLVPDVAADTLRANLNPAPANLAIDNTVRLDRSACRRGAGGVSITTPDGPSGNRIAFGGHYASGCGSMTFSRAVMRAPDFAYGTFRTLWQQSGGRLDGGWRVGVLPPDATEIFSYDSLSLAEIIRLINKFSSNSMARQLLLTVAAEKAGPPGTTDGGRRAIVDFLASRGISIPETRARERVRAVARRAHLGAGARRRAAVGLAQPVHAGVRRFAAAFGHRRHVAQAVPRAGDAGAPAHEDRHAGGRERAGRLRERSVRPHVRHGHHPESPGGRRCGAGGADGTGGVGLRPVAGVAR